MPRRFPRLRSCYNVMIMPGEVIVMLSWLRRRVDAGEMTIAEAVEEVEEAITALSPDPASRHPKWDETWKGLIWLARKLSRRRMKLSDAVRFMRVPKQGGAPLPMLFGYAEGARDGREARAAASLTSLPPGSMGGMTGVPLAVGLEMLHAGIIDRKGVFAPEEAIDPDAFFDRLAPLCSPPRLGAAALLRVSLST